MIAVALFLIGLCIGAAGGYIAADRREARREAQWRAAMRTLPRHERRRATREMAHKWSQQARR